MSFPSHYSSPTAAVARRRLRSRIVVAWFALALQATMGVAAPDDVEALPAAAVVQAQFHVDDSNFDQWVFQGVGGAAKARERLTSRLKLQIDEIDRTCDLSAAQKQKLALAGRGDTKRFFDEVEEARRKFDEVKNDQAAFNGIWQEIQPLQQKLQRGLFGPTSLYAKTVRKTLTAEQAAKYNVIVDERRRYRYRVNVEVAVVTLGNSIAFRHEQHEAIVKLLLDMPPPAEAPVEAQAQNNYYIMVKQLATVPQDKLRPLLDERQWKLLQRQLNQFRNVRF